MTAHIRPASQRQLEPVLGLKALVYIGRCDPVCKSPVAITSQAKYSLYPVPDRRFQTTRWSLVVAAVGDHSTVAKQALATLCEIYWPSAVSVQPDATWYGLADKTPAALKAPGPTEILIARSMWPSGTIFG